MFSKSLSEKKIENSLKPLMFDVSMSISTPKALLFETSARAESTEGSKDGRSEVPPFNWDIDTLRLHVPIACPHCLLLL